jgi:hypothetical protein
MYDDSFLALCCVYCKWELVHINEAGLVHISNAEVANIAKPECVHICKSELVDISKAQLVYISNLEWVPLPQLAAIMRYLTSLFLCVQKGYQKGSADILTSQCAIPRHICTFPLLYLYSFFVLIAGCTPDTNDHWSS